MGDLILIPDAEALDDVADPATAVRAMLVHAKELLALAKVTDLPDVAEARTRADAIRHYVEQKNLASEAQLDATEIVRRAERRIGELIREGQAAGEIRWHGYKQVAGAHAAGGSIIPAPGDFLSRNALFGTDDGVYAMTDGITSDEFEEGLIEARTEQNLSRRNVIRKVRKASSKVPASRRISEIRDLAAAGHNAEQIAEAIDATAFRIRQLARDNDITLPDGLIGPTRRIDSNRIVGEAVATLEGVVLAVSLVDPAALDGQQIEVWAVSLRRSLRSLNQFVKEACP